jgi:hypothetical protein
MPILVRGKRIIMWQCKNVGKSFMLSHLEGLWDENDMKLVARLPLINIGGYDGQSKRFLDFLMGN